MMKTAIRLVAGIAFLFAAGVATAEEIDLFPEGTFDADPRAAASKDDASDAEEQARLSEMFCGRYGPDYTLVAGTTTCIKVNGHVQVDVYVGTRKNR